MASVLRMSFLNRGKEEFDRDIRPADGRLSHHWFFVVGNAKNGSDVTIKYRPSIKLVRNERQYQDLWLVEFDAAGNITQRVKLNPNSAFNTATGEIDEIIAYTYKNAGEAVRYFRLDIQKASLVATDFTKGSSGWKFFSVPITPQRDDPFVNLGDDIDPFQMFKYDTKLNGYKVYPLDIGEVSLQAGYGYFPRLDNDIEVDVGGASNNSSMELTLETAGWHAIGNPFILPVNVSDLKINGKVFATAVADGLVEGTLYRWKTDAVGADAYDAVTGASQLAPWGGYWVKTKQANAKLTIPAPAGLANAVVDLPGSYDPPLAPPIEQTPDGLQFALRMELLSGTSSDITTTLGAQRDAQYGYDIFDQSEPPALGQTVSLYFDHSDW